jgi:uncharacterized membrane protein
MTERVQILLLQIVGGVVVAGIMAGAAWASMKGYPIQASVIGSLVSALIGKLFGQPIAAVTLNHVSKLPPPMAAEAARRAIASLPPQTVSGDARSQLEQASVVLTGISTPPPPPPLPVPPPRGHS